MKIKITFDCSECAEYHSKVVSLPYSLIDNDDFTCPHCNAEALSVLRINEAIYELATFTLEGLSGTFEGYSDGETLNGNELPMFSRNEMLRILNLLHNNEYDNPIIYVHEKGSMVEEDKFINDKFEYPIVDITVGNEQVRVCGLGSGRWLWKREL